MALMMVVQFGLAYYARQVLSGAAQDGAAAGARRDSSPEAGRQLAENLVAQSGSSLLVGYRADVVEQGGQVTVTLRGEVVSLMPFQRSLSVVASGSAPTETFRPQGSAP